MIGTQDEIKLIEFLAHNLADHALVWKTYAQWKKEESQRNEEIDRPCTVAFSLN